jgi:hypothetical protein
LITSSVSTRIDWRRSFFPFTSQPFVLPSSRSTMLGAPASSSRKIVAWWRETLESFKITTLSSSRPIVTLPSRGMPESLSSRPL